MDKPFLVGMGGLVLDANERIVATITSPDAEIRSTLIMRLNLFDDLLRIAEALNQYRAAGLPIMVIQDVESTLKMASICK